MTRGHLNFLAIAFPRPHRPGVTIAEAKAHTHTHTHTHTRTHTHTHRHTHDPLASATHGCVYSALRRLVCWDGMLLKCNHSSGIGPAMFRAS